MSTTNYVQVYTASGQLEGEIIRLYLEAGGIEAQASQESAGIVHGLTVGRLGEVKILVPEDQEAAAIELLWAMEQNQGGTAPDLIDEEAEDLPGDLEES